MNNLFKLFNYPNLIFLFFSTTFAINSQNDDRIIFLYLKKQNSTITLERSSIIKGKLKSRFKNTFAGLEYSVALESGRTILSGVVKDPTLVSCDYIDPNDPLRLKGGRVIQNEARFVIKIPYMEGMDNISFYENIHGKRRGKLVNNVSLKGIYSEQKRAEIKQSILDRATIQLVQGDSSENRVHYCVFSEGYTQSELNSGKFVNDLKRGIEYQFSQTPFRQYKGHFAVWAISVASSSSGVGGYFESTWSGRLLYCRSSGMQKAYKLLEDLKPNWDMGLILVNTTTYGGAGSEIAVSSINRSNGGGLIAHETGHGYAGLGDEYDSPGATPSETPNTTQETDRNQIKWRFWIESSTPIPTPETSAYSRVIGLFEGAAYMTTGWYRPKLKCAMNWLQDPFCEVCAETIIARAYKNVSPADQIVPGSLNVHYNDINNKELKIVPLQPTENTVRTIWSVNGTSVSINSHTLDLTKVTLNQGNNTITAYVADTTTRIRIPVNFPPPRDTITWNVTYGTNAILGHIQVNPFSLQIDRASHRNISVSFNLPSRYDVFITLFDSRGRNIERSFNDNMPKGFHRIKLSRTKKMSKGIYFISASFNGHKIVRKVQIVS